MARLIADRGGDSLVCLARTAATAAEATRLDEYRAAGVEIIYGDLLDNPVSHEAPPRVDLVFHLAANIDPAAPDSALQVNVAGTRHLIDWLGPQLGGARVVYASSVAVHDRAERPTGPLSEDSPFAPRTAYGQTKLRGEVIIMERALREDYTWTILRLPTVYGPGQKPNGLFDSIAKLARTGAWLARLNWPGRTSVMHVDDVAAAMIDISGRVEAAGEVYCLASDEPSLTVGEIARCTSLAVGRQDRQLNVPGSLWRLAEALVWSRAVYTLLPAKVRVALWRLSLMVSDGFWFDNSKFRQVYHGPLRNVADGLADTTTHNTPSAMS
jgi:nucleoside-diphosphate-sugar epimerase